MPIHRLDRALTLKIAAGEVVDRPASIVKELAENAIDARSERIEVLFEDGGRSRIVIRDDGTGMSEDDLRLSIERYATSKISSEADLSNIRSLGFRGEALASVAAVSRLKIVTKESGEESAYELVAEGGELVRCDPAARPTGTTVDVTDLFFNVPARAKFLGSARTESLHIHRILQRLAVLCPEIGWEVRHGSREVLLAPRVGSQRDRLVQIYGGEIAEALIPIEIERENVRITGFVSRPDLRRSNRRDQMFVVNGRFVSDRGLSFVLSSAYRGMLRPGSFPLALVQIELPPQLVDVNVHPRKEEVRFAQVRQVQDAVAAALQKALSSQAVVVPLGPSSPRGAAHVNAPEHALHSSGQRTLNLHLGREMAVSKAVHEAEKVRPQADRLVLGQIHATYLLVESPEGLEIVDQHIAHEQILYTKLQREWAGGIARQVFLLPVRVEVPFEQAAIIASHLAELAEVGVVLDEFGGGTFLIREFPQALANSQARTGFQQIVEMLADTLSEGRDLKQMLYTKLLSNLACGAAIKAGDAIPLVEAQDLVDELMKLEDPYTCPHGRPIIVSYSKHELDKRFKRA